MTIHVIWIFTASTMEAIDDRSTQEVISAHVHQISDLTQFLVYNLR